MDLALGNSVFVPGFCVLTWFECRQFFVPECHFGGIEFVA